MKVKNRRFLCKKKIDFTEGLGGLLISFSIFICQAAMVVGFLLIVNSVGMSFRAKVLCDAMAVSAAHGSFNMSSEEFDTQKAEDIAYTVYLANMENANQEHIYYFSGINIYNPTKSLQVEITANNRGHHYVTTTVMQGYVTTNKAPTNEGTYPWNINDSCSPLYTNVMHYKHAPQYPGLTKKGFNNILTQFDILIPRYLPSLSSASSAASTLYNDTASALGISSEAGNDYYFKDVSIADVSDNGQLYVLCDGSNRYFIHFNNNGPCISYISDSFNEILPISSIPNASFKVFSSDTPFTMYNPNL